jgi:hypothetical protein
MGLIIIKPFYLGLTCNPGHIRKVWSEYIDMICTYWSHECFKICVSKETFWLSDSQKLQSLPVLASDSSLLSSVPYILSSTLSLLGLSSGTPLCWELGLTILELTPRIPTVLSTAVILACLCLFGILIMLHVALPSLAGLQGVQSLPPGGNQNERLKFRCPEGPPTS